MSTEDVPIVVTIDTRIKRLSAIVLLHFEFQNNETYFHFSDYFEMQSAIILLHSKA